MKYVLPSVCETSFNCPHCEALAHQSWYSLKIKELSDNGKPRILNKEECERLLEDIKYDDEEDKERKNYLIRELPKGRPFHVKHYKYDSIFELYNIFISECFSCKRLSVWIYNNLLYPQRGKAPLANPDLSEDIRRDYDEASTILDLSPRGAAALLRLAIQKLCKELGQPGKNINADIAALVSEGLNQQIQRSLDIVRVIGNNAVHPGQIDLRDDKAVAESLFTFVNLIADKMISEPKHIEEAYAGLPERAQEAIDRRDASNSQEDG